MVGAEGQPIDVNWSLLEKGKKALKGVRVKRRVLIQAKIGQKNIKAKLIDT